MTKKIISVLAALIFAAFTAFAVYPAAYTAIDNGKAAKCLRNSYILRNKLEEFLNGEKENKLWYDLIAEKNSSKLLNALNSRLEKPVDISSYYIKFGDGEVTVLCRAHPTVLNVSAEIPDNVISYAEDYTEPKSDYILYIEAYGRDIYFQNTILDYNNINKTQFTGSDNLAELFPDIKVKAHFAGGGERVLRPDEYTIRGNLDMTKAGKKTLGITFKNQAWMSRLFTAFDIYVLDNEQREPLVVDGGNFGVYELASWVWTDYVADAMNADGSYMDFDASIVFDGGVYYYYPDGFAILKENEDNGSIKGAVDISNHKKEAYHIEFNTKKVINSNKESDSSMKDGYLKVGAQDKVYIWQSVPSKELPKGWIEVYCEKNKLS